MAFHISDKALNQHLERDLAKAGEDRADALAKLSSGQVFTPYDPRPTERAISDGLEFRLRSIAASKRNINDAVSLLQTAEGGMQEITNMVLRMKELNISAASTTMTDHERKFLLLEYQALHDEITRIATTTRFNGIPLLNGNDPDTPEEMILRIDEPFNDGEGSGDIADDINAIQFQGLKAVVATAAGLGLKSAGALLSESSEGITFEDAQELLISEEDEFATAYDQAINTLSTHRSIFGAIQARLNRSMDFMDVFQENIAAAKSKIADTDYAEQVSRLTRASIMMNASSSLLAQSNLNAQLSLNLLTSFMRG